MKLEIIGEKFLYQILESYNMENWSSVLMSERNLWRYIQKNLKQTNNMLMRVENAFYKGIPDVNYLIDGVEGWVELKYVNEYPKRESTEIKVSHFTTEQKLWHNTRNKMNGLASVLVQVESDYFLFKKERINLIGALTKRKMFQLSNKSWKNKINFEELKKELCEK